MFSWPKRIKYVNVTPRIRARLLILTTHTNRKTMSRILNEISFGSKLKTGMYYITKHFILLHQLTHKGWLSNKPMFKQYCCKASSAEYSDINLVLFYAVKFQPLQMWHKVKDQVRLYSPEPGQYVDCQFQN